MGRKKRTTPWVLEAAVYSALRRADRNSPMYREALEAAKVEYTVLSKHGKPMRRVGYKCAHCGKMCRKRNKTDVKRTEFASDHKSPVIDPVLGNQGYDVYIKRLFVLASSRQILCNVGKASCHSIKTKQENKIRNEIRKEQKAYEQRLKEDARADEADRTGASPGSPEV